MKMRTTLSGLVLAAVLASPATACLNDRQVIASENEFKSSYLAKEKEKGFFARVSPGGWMAVGLGLTMLGTTAVLSLRSPGRRR